MRTEHLEILVELARTQSMSLAGKYLHISHQGISSSIARLEDELGVTLLTRTKNGVFLTEAGQEYVDLMNQFLIELAALKQKTTKRQHEKPSDLEGFLTIYNTHPFNIEILPNTILGFCRKYPKIKLISREVHTTQVIKAVEDGDSEIGLVMLLEGTNNELAEKTSLKFEKLFINPIYGLVSKDLAISSRKSVSFKELLKYPLVAFLDSRNIVIKHILSNPDIYGKPKVVLDSDDTKTRSKIISEGGAVGFTNKYALSMRDEFPENVVAIPINDKLNFVCGYIRNVQYDLTLAAEAFIEFLKTNIK
ncbi:LysR family transcriptional regulator [Dehalobacter sp. DCM]|uniref:LysR family transcriptional regulator n=1 Tax=Dehalobacter sp. DCM TaxID=2907827 RepID=UPI0030820597|nr:LysR family transcriptional regulator [Dehalobacter sp. DCM]